MSAVRAGAAATLAVGLALASGCSVLKGSASLTFRIDSMECSPAKAADTIGTVCSFLAYYGNVGGHSIQVEPGTTRVLDRAGRTFAPVAEAQDGDAFLLKPGQQQPISWSVTLPVNAKPSRVTWHGSRVPVLLASGLDASVAPSASATALLVPSVVPSTSPVPTSAVPTTTRPSTTTKPVVKPTKTKPKVKVKATPSKTTVKPTTVPPTTPPPPTTTRPPIVHHTSAAPTTNSTNPGGGSGGIG